MFSVPRNIICADTPESPTSLYPPKTGAGSMPAGKSVELDVDCRLMVFALTLARGRLANSRCLDDRERGWRWTWSDARVEAMRERARVVVAREGMMERLNECGVVL